MNFCNEKFETNFNSQFSNLFRLAENFCVALLRKITLEKLIIRIANNKFFSVHWKNDSMIT